MKKNLHVSPGDFVCMMLNSPVPFLLRKEFPHFRFLGSCYLEDYKAHEVPEVLVHSDVLTEYSLK